MRLLLTIPVLIFCTQTYCQTAMVTDEAVLSVAKRSAQSKLTLLRDTLSLTRRQSRIRGFSLDKCEIKGPTSESTSWTPKGDFAFRIDCPGIYTFNHQTNDKGSYYDITFFFDANGVLRHTNISWTLAVH